MPVLNSIEFFSYMYHIVLSFIFDTHLPLFFKNWRYDYFCIPKLYIFIMASSMMMIFSFSVSIITVQHTCSSKCYWICRESTVSWITTVWLFQHSIWTKLYNCYQQTGWVINLLLFNYIHFLFPISMLFDLKEKIFSLFC